MKTCYSWKHTALCFLLSFVLIHGGAARASHETKTFHSDALGTEKTYLIYLPPGYDSDPEKRYPSLYLLHGYNFARNNPDLAPVHEEENHWIVQEQLGEVADCLFSAGDYSLLLSCLKEKNVEFPEAIVNDMKAEYQDCPLPLPPMIIVMPDGDSSFYADRRDGKKQWPPLDGPEFVNGVRKGATGQYETYIYNDLANHIDATYRTMAERDKRGIGGFSMGGIGSMNILLRHPDVFVSVSALSAIFTLSDMLNDPFGQGLDKTTPEIRNIFSLDADNPKAKLDPAMVEKYDPYYALRDFTRTDVFIYYDAGAGDFFSGMNNFKTFDKFEKGLVKKGLKSYPSKHIVPANEMNAKGMHTSDYWRSRIGVFLTFHAKAFGLL